VTFRFTAKQQAAQYILAGEAKHLMLFGGSRSGKTFLLVRNLIARALKAPFSRHVIFRFRFNALRASVVQDTFPKVMRLAFPGIPYKLDKEAWFATLPNGAEIWFGGLDDKERTEKILGMEFVTIYLNECSQISYDSRNLTITRLAQSVMQEIEGRVPEPLKPRVYYDENPPSKAHWSYRLFVQKVDPETKEALAKPDDFAWFQINPADNAENIANDYIDTLSSMSARLRRRFLDGEFSDATPGALFADEIIEKWRKDDAEPLPDMVRIVVGVDPSGSGDVDNADNDAIGIVITGLATDGNAYVLEDCTVKAGPATWGKVVTDAYVRHGADIVVGEVNYGGAMVNHVVQTSRARTPFKSVHASRGKVVRAEPFSSLYEAGKVRHAGRFSELEDELSSFTTNGYLGGVSPNRADALIWTLAELFPAMVAGPKPELESVIIPSLANRIRRQGPSAAIPSLR
jgi:PBSX family phage terminase large subunit